MRGWGRWKGCPPCAYGVFARRLPNLSNRRIHNPFSGWVPFFSTIYIHNRKNERPSERCEHPFYLVDARLGNILDQKKATGAAVILCSPLCVCVGVHRNAMKCVFPHSHLPHGWAEQRLYSHKGYARTHTRAHTHTCTRTRLIATMKRLLWMWTTGRSGGNPRLLVYSHPCEPNFHVCFSFGAFFKGWKSFLYIILS